MADTSMNKRQMVAAMAQALGIDIDPDQYAAEVVRQGDKIILPDGASIPEVIESLQKEYDKERQKVSVQTTLPCAPWDGAIALEHAMKDELGFVIAKSDWGEPPTEIEVEYELGKTMAVRWGKFELAGMGNGAIAQTGVQRDSTTGEFHFMIKITCIRRWQERAKKILDHARAFVQKNAIHKGKAFSIQFFNSDGELVAIPTPKFFPFAEHAPIFRKTLENAIERNIFTPIKYSKELQGMGESLKRGVLFAGKYGVGKTMLASHIAQYAISQGWTFIYVKDSQELPYALRYAQRYQPVVVFAEDVERVAGSERTDSVNNLLNQLDGVDSKSAQIMTVLTSNHSDKVNAAMRRPGRIDLILQVLPPDAETIHRMVKAFVGSELEPNTDLSEIGNVLEGFAPAYIREACGRARLEALRRTGNTKSLINGEDLGVVAKEVKAEKELFTGSEKDDSPANMNVIAKGFKAASDTMLKAVAAGGK
jgi:transitional endoplasmic reticulum ATPase